MRDGFLGFQTSFMLDFVVCALVIVVPLLVWSLWSVKIGRRYQRHRNLQVLLGVILLVAVGAFEVDLHLVQGGWENIVAKSSSTDQILDERVAEARPWLYFHLVFAVSTPFLWALTLFLAFKKFSRPPQPGTHSRTHKLLGWASSVDITMTAITGLLFYYVAFVQR